MFNPFLAVLEYHRTSVRTIEKISGATEHPLKPDVSDPHCPCPDYETRNVKCKHIWAVEFVIQREFSFDETDQHQNLYGRRSRLKNLPSGTAQL